MFLDGGWHVCVWSWQLPSCSLALDDAVPAKQCDGVVVCEEGVLPCAAQWAAARVVHRVFSPRDAQSDLLQRQDMQSGLPRS